METRDLSAVSTVEAAEGVHLAQLVAGDRMSIQHFHFEPGAAVPEHSHEHEQLGYLYRGSVTFYVSGEEIVIGTGESYAVPSDEPHRVVNEGADPAQGIDIFAPPRPNPDWAMD